MYLKYYKKGGGLGLAKLKLEHRETSRLIIEVLNKIWGAANFFLEFRNTTQSTCNVHFTFSREVGGVQTSKGILKIKICNNL